MSFHDDAPEPDLDDAPRPTPRRSRDPYAGPEGEAMLRRAADLVASAKPLPLSSSVMINKDEVLEVLTGAIDRLPDELKQARFLLKEREDYLARMRAEGDAIIDSASAKAEAMVQRTEVVKAAEQKARRIVDDADQYARDTRMEVEDFCDQRLAQFEIVLNRTLRMVHAGREKLSGVPMTAPDGREGPGEDAEPTAVAPTDPTGTTGQGGPVAPAGPSDEGAAFFDQDEV